MGDFRCFRRAEFCDFTQNFAGKNFYPSPLGWPDTARCQAKPQTAGPKAAVGRKISFIARAVEFLIKFLYFFVKFRFVKVLRIELHR